MTGHPAQSEAEGPETLEPDRRGRPTRRVRRGAMVAVAAMILTVLCGTLLSLTSSHSAWAAANIGVNDYQPTGQFEARSCGDFVAWRLRQAGVTRNGVLFANDWANNAQAPNGTTSFGNAGNWADYAAFLGYAVDTAPTVGSVAQWMGNESSYFPGGYIQAGPLGHVAYVMKVNPNGTVDIEEYNQNNDGAYHQELGVTAPRYIHFESTGPGSPPPPPPPPPPPSSQQIVGSGLAVTANTDGRLEAFGVTPNGTVVHNYQSNSNGSVAWSGWTALPDPGANMQSVAAATNYDGRVEVFATKTDGSLWHQWQQTAGQGDWSGWAPMDGQVGALAATSNADGRLELFVTNPSNGSVSYRSQLDVNGSSGWSAWAPFDGQFAQLAAGTNADGRLEVFSTRTDGSLWHQWEQTPGQGDWSGWSPMDGPVGYLAVTRGSSGALDLYVTNPNNFSIWHRWQNQPNGVNGGWSAWAGVNATGYSIAAATDGTGQMQALVAGDNVAWHATDPNPSGATWGWAWQQFAGAIRD